MKLRKKLRKRLIADIGFGGDYLKIELSDLIKDDSVLTFLEVELSFSRNSDMELRCYGGRYGLYPVIWSNGMIRKSRGV